MNNCIAIDYGTFKTGLAYSVESFAFAWKTVPTSSLFMVLPKFIKEKQASIVIVGMPYNIDGSMSKHGKRVQKFIKEIEGVITIPVTFHDERLTTSEAQMGFEEVGIEGDIDAEAARLILDDYLKTR